jgi:hypothetical protein
MVLGAVWCPADARVEISSRIKSLKQRHRIAKDFEIKWGKVSPAQGAFYEDLIHYFFTDERLHFRGVVIPDKSKLDHEAFMQDHDTFYYKMYFVLLKQVLDPESRYRIYLDMKDTRGGLKVKKLHEVLCNDFYDFDKTIIEDVKQVRSHEVDVLQFADLFVGALAYAHRALNTSRTKLFLIERIRQLSHHNLLRTTLPKEDKFNLLVWSAREW